MIRSIAIHLPQFHPFEENDAWWGKGFTEWTNVTKAKPLFKDHYQPHLPSDLGFYDLRVEEARIAQAELARQYGIDGFCYYHYWFNGKRLMQQPLDDMLQSKKPDFPFMLCWANENWTRRWDGKEEEVLIRQTYSDEDDTEHIRFLCKTFFADPRYIRVNGKPFFLFYRPGLFPDIRKTITVFRDEAKKQGIGELYLGYVQTFSFNESPSSVGFDCAIEFQPDFMAIPDGLAPQPFDKLLHFTGIRRSPFMENKIASYPEFVDKMIAKPKNPPDIYPGITPGWDNTARRQTKAIIFIDSEPEHYERWLRSIKQKYQGDETVLFINAWNEWAEGNHLEPCHKWGRRFLEATAKVLKES